MHLAEGAHLRRRPDDRARQQHDDHQLLDACRVALAEQVREGGEPAAPQGPREEDADDDDGGRVADRIDQRARKPFS